MKQDILSKVSSLSKQYNLNKEELFNKLVELRTPKNGSNKYPFNCPNNCGSFAVKGYKFCPNCGQALDWSDNNE